MAERIKNGRDEIFRVDRFVDCSLDRYFLHSVTLSSSLSFFFYSRNVGIFFARPSSPFDGFFLLLFFGRELAYRKRHVEFSLEYVTETVAAAADEYRAGKQKEVVAAAASLLVSVEKMKETTACLLIQKLQAY